MRKIVIILLVVMSSNAYLACSCVDPESSWFFEGIETAFIGELKAKQWSFSRSDRKYQFSVKETVKGKVPKEITIFTARHSMSCGKYFRKNREYLVIVGKVKNKYRTSLCSSWQLNSEIAKSVLHRLNPPNKSLNKDVTDIAPIS